MNGTPDNSDSGYCDYVPPTGLENTYDGNATQPNSGAAQWCYPPYRCPPDPLGCDNRQPTYETFVSYGEARVFGDPSKELQYSLTAKNVGRTPDVRTEQPWLPASPGGPSRRGSDRWRSERPWPALSCRSSAWCFPRSPSRSPSPRRRPSRAPPRLSRLAIIAAAQASLSAELAAAQAAGPALIASSVAAVVVVAIIAIAIAVIKGIQVVEDAAVPGRLRDLISNSLSGTPDLQAMLSDGSDLRGLFGLFIRAAGPRPQPATCDNSYLFTNVVSGGPMTGSTMVAPVRQRDAHPPGSRRLSSSWFSAWHSAATTDRSCRPHGQAELRRPGRSTPTGTWSASRGPTEHACPAGGS